MYYYLLRCLIVNNEWGPLICTLASCGYSTGDRTFLYHTSVVHDQLIVLRCWWIAQQ